MAHFERIRYRLLPQKLRPRLKACAIWAVSSLYYNRETLSSTSRASPRLCVNCSTGLHTRINPYLFLLAQKVAGNNIDVFQAFCRLSGVSICHRSVMSLGALRFTLARQSDKVRDLTESSSIPPLRLDDYRGSCPASTTILCSHRRSSC